MNKLTELDALEDVVKRLDACGLEYMITGSMAMNYYAQPRMTRDIDIVVALDAGNIGHIKDAFSDDYYIQDDDIDRAINDTGIFNIVHLDKVVKVDIIIRKSGYYRQLEFERRIPIEIANFKTWIVSKEDLILSKLCWSKDSKSELQMCDIKNLLKTSPDMAYLDKWASELGVKEILEEYIDE